tara:strand:+ start:192 stop:608 length:417 start_codon:yes stop_codon:yes gene_type:complete
MGYAIELSFDVRKEGAWHSQLNSRKNLAEEYGCAMQYFTHEIEGKGKNTLKSDSVQVIVFSEENLENFLCFIRTMRQQPKNYIDCIYEDDTTCKLLYASPQYIRKMDKDLARIYRKERKTWKPTTDIELKVFDAMKKR